MEVHAGAEAWPKLQAFLGNFQVRLRRPEARAAPERYTTGSLTELPNKHRDTLAHLLPADLISAAERPNPGEEKERGMSAIALPDSGFNGPGGMTRAMLETLRVYWAAATGYQRFLYGTGAVLIASGVFHLGVMAVHGGSWTGDVSWRKPIVFGLSFGLTSVFLAWCMTFLPRRRIRGWLLSAALAVPGALEIALITMQQWRGVPSHFNTTTPFDAAVWGLMGLAITFIMAAIFAMMLWVLFLLRAPGSLAWAIRLGMALLCASQVFGLLIAMNGSNIFGEAGVMKLPHALSLHGIQVLPVTAWLLLFTGWSEGQRMRVVLLATAGYYGLVAAAAYQTFSGFAPSDMRPGPALGHLASAGLLGLAGAAVLAAFWQRLRRRRGAPARSARTRCTQARG